LSLETRIKARQNLERMLDWFDQSLASECRLDEMEPQMFTWWCNFLSVLSIA
jgi:hypothetical protein